MLVSVVEAGSVPYSDFQPLPLKFQQLELLLGLDRWNRSSSFWAPVVQQAQPEQTTITKLKDELADHGSLNKRNIWVSGVCQTFKPEWRLSGKPIEHFVNEFNIKQSAVKPAAVRSQQLLRFTEAGVRVLVWTQSDFWAVHGLNVKSVVQPHSPYCARLIWKHDAVVIRLASFTLYNTKLIKIGVQVKALHSDYEDILYHIKLIWLIFWGSFCLLPDTTARSRRQGAAGLNPTQMAAFNLCGKQSHAHTELNWHSD